MSIEALPPTLDGRKRWLVRWRVDGQAMKQTCYSKHEAQTLQNEIDAAKLSESVMPVSSRQAITVSDAMAEWAEEWAKPFLKARTRKTYAISWDKHCQELEPYRLTDLCKDPSILNRWWAGMRKRDVGHEATIKALTVVSSVLEYAHDAGYAPTNPARRIRGRRKRGTAPKRKPVRAISPMTVEAVRLQLAKPEHRVLVGLIAWAGLRPGEACRARFDEITDGYLYVMASKTEKERYVPIPQLIIDEIGALDHGHERILNKETWTEDMWRSWQRNTFRAAAKRAGEIVGQNLDTLRPYDLRHSSTSARLRAGGAPAGTDHGRFSPNPVTVAEDHGHSLRVLTDVYSHWVKLAQHASGQPFEQQLATARKEAAELTATARARD